LSIGKFRKPEKGISPSYSKRSNLYNFILGKSSNPGKPGKILGL
jgi:hypothetical protein